MIRLALFWFLMAVGILFSSKLQAQIKQGLSLQLSRILIGRNLSLRYIHSINTSWNAYAGITYALKESSDFTQVSAVWMNSYYPEKGWRSTGFRGGLEKRILKNLTGEQSALYLNYDLQFHRGLFRRETLFPGEDANGQITYTHRVKMVGPRSCFANNFGISGRFPVTNTVFISCTASTGIDVYYTGKEANLAPWDTGFEGSLAYMFSIGIDYKLK